MRFILLSSLLPAIVTARVVPRDHVVHERRSVESIRWTKGDRIASDLKLPVRIGLKQNEEALGQAVAWLMDVSHPRSEKYGQHWTQDEIIEAFRPAEESVDQVIRWVETAAGVPKHRITHTDNKAWLAFDATTSQLEDLVQAQYHEHYDEASGRSMISCDEYHIPRHLQAHIDYITPGVKGIHVATSSLRKRSRKSTTTSNKSWRQPKERPAAIMPKNDSQLATCDSAVTPACLQALYNFSPLDPHAAVSSNNSMGIFEEGDYYAQEDLNLFYRNFTSYIKNGTGPTLDGIDGGTAPTTLKKAGGESNLDFELAIPIIYPQTTTLYQTDDYYYAYEGGNGTTTGIFNTFLDAIDGSYCTYSAYGETGDDPVLDPTYPDPHGYKGQLMCGTYKPTNVISISYGEQEQDLPAYYQKRQCNEFLKLGLQGVSIFVASGDTGVGGLPGDGAANGCLNNGTVFSPTQPNSCPWLTNVGGTQIDAGKTVHQNESAVNDGEGFSSSGGFSNIFPIPDYQAKAVANYFMHHNPPYPYYYNGSYENSTGLYNRNGRGIPDVAANGENIAIFLRGRFGLEGGTSASSPIFAALMNRINEERIRVGKGPVGFVNPALYEHAFVLNDIVNGTNPGCSTEGFSAVEGWDPVTGLGTPDYAKMCELFLGLP